MDCTPRVVGLLPSGMTQATAEKVAAKIFETFRQRDGSTVRALRIIPSSLVNRGGVIEFVANTTVEPKRSRTDAPPGRSKVIDSVVTLDTSGDVRAVRIPFLERAVA